MQERHLVVNIIIFLYHSLLLQYCVFLYDVYSCQILFEIYFLSSFILNVNLFLAVLR